MPAGIYARQWLESLHLWRAIEPKVIPTDNVRAALAAVEAGNVDVAIVYRTDVLRARRVRIASNSGFSSEAAIPDQRRSSSAT